MAMTNNERLREMANIINAKEREAAEHELQPLDPEGQTMAERKRLTFDTLTVDVDPLR